LRNLYSGFSRGVFFSKIKNSSACIFSKFRLNSGVFGNMRFTNAVFGVRQPSDFFLVCHRRQGVFLVWKRVFFLELGRDEFFFSSWSFKNYIFYTAVRYQFTMQFTDAKFHIFQSVICIRKTISNRIYCLGLSRLVSSAGSFLTKMIVHYWTIFCFIESFLPGAAIIFSFRNGRNNCPLLQENEIFYRNGEDGGK